MDVEKTMQFILDTQARTEAILQSVSERQDRAEARQERTEVRVDKMEARLDRRMNAIVKVLHAGMKMGVEIRRAQKEGEYKLNALIHAQQKTEKKLQAFIDSLRKSRNGR